MNPAFHLRSLFNQIGHEYRSRWSLMTYIANMRSYQEPAEVANQPIGFYTHTRDNAADWATEEARLIKTYQLEAFRHHCQEIRYIDTLNHLQFLELYFRQQSLPEKENTPLRWLDVGAKNWLYVKAIDAFLTKALSSQTAERGHEIVGIEIDPNRLYVDGHTRKGHALSYIQNTPHINYIAGDAMQHHERYDVISSFLPFIVPEPCLNWGLPLNKLQPQAMLSHLTDLLNPNGVLLIMNQDDDEDAVQAELLEKEPRLKVIQHIALPESFLQYEYTRYAYTCVKKEA
jgi:hypothetical protein